MLETPDPTGLPGTLVIGVLVGLWLSVAAIWAWLAYGNDPRMTVALAFGLGGLMVLASVVGLQLVA